MAANRRANLPPNPPRPASQRSATASSQPSWRCSPRSRSSRSASPRSRRAPASRSPICASEFGSTLAILAAHMKEIDRAVLRGIDADMAEEPPRERLFDVLMRRIEALAPHKDAVRSLARSATRNPGLAFALNGLAVRSQQWMLTAADISASGPNGMVRAQGLALLFASVLRTLRRRRRSGPCPHHGGARPRARARPALVRFSRRSLPHSGTRLPRAARAGARTADEETIAA